MSLLDYIETQTMHNEIAVERGQYMYDHIKELETRLAEREKELVAANQKLLDLSEETHCCMECERRENEIERLREALEKIARSAPCKESHESFNTPGQMCDQRIAEAVLSDEAENGHG